MAESKATKLLECIFYFFYYRLYVEETSIYCIAKLENRLTDMNVMTQTATACKVKFLRRVSVN